MLNEYVNVYEIGKGSFSKVYSARHRDTGNPVAIKKIRMDVFNRYKIRILAELDMTRKLRHQNILSFYEIYQSKNNIYILSELCDGTMSMYIEKNNTEKEIHKIYKQIMDGIKYLYDNNIYHRDIKPENILIKDDVIKIADFGFAKEISGNEKVSSTICGSPSYMAPELILDQPENRKSDIWSLGVILYQMMYNRHPAGEVKDYVRLYSFYSNQKEITFKNTYSKGLNDLVKNMLIYDIDKRISWNNLFSNKWLNDDIDDTSSLNESMFLPISSSNESEIFNSCYSEVKNSMYINTNKSKPIAIKKNGSQLTMSTIPKAESLKLDICGKEIEINEDFFGESIVQPFQKNHTYPIDNKLMRHPSNSTYNFKFGIDAHNNDINNQIKSVKSEDPIKNDNDKIDEKNDSLWKFIKKKLFNL